MNRPDMTCQQLRVYFKDPLRYDDAVAEEAAHLSHCENCARFVAAQRQLGSGLRESRESVPPFPSALDAAVLEHYRQDIADRAQRAAASPQRRLFPVSSWAVVAAALMVVAAFLLFFRSQRVFFTRVQRAATVAPRVSTPRAALSASSIAAPSQEISQPEVGRRPASERHATKVKPAKSSRTKSSFSARSESPAASFVAADGSRPPILRSLMYCDELSCGQEMELIRVQLPAPVAAPVAAPGSAPASGPVFADVLIGPDGIARGIRIVQ